MKKPSKGMSNLESRMRAGFATVAPATPAPAAEPSSPDAARPEQSNPGGGAVQRQRPPDTPDRKAPRRRRKSVTHPSLTPRYDRDELVLVTFRAERLVRDQLRILATQRGITVRAVLHESVNDTFSKYGMPELASFESPRDPESDDQDAHESD